MNNELNITSFVLEELCHKEWKVPVVILNRFWVVLYVAVSVHTFMQHCAEYKSFSYNWNVIYDNGKVKPFKNRYTMLAMAFMYVCMQLQNDYIEQLLKTTYNYAYCVQVL